jgi:Flp pilus assembly protein TadD
MPRIAACLGVLAVSALVCTPATAASADPQSGITMSESLDAGLRDAQLKRSQRDFAGAVRVLSQLMLVSADDPRVVGEYGKVLVQQGRSREALDFLKRAVQLQQGDWTYFSALGVAYDQTGDYANARLAYEQALALQPGELAILNNYAMSRAQAGDLADAKRLIAQASTGVKNEQVTRNMKLINGLAPKVAAATPQPARPAAVAPKAVAVTTLSPATGSPRVLTSAEGKRIVMQAVPVDSKAGPVGKTKTVRKVATAEKKKADPNTIPPLRLANDRQ